MENPEWSHDCALHNAYMHQNGGTLTHTEDPAAPGYTAGGAFAAGSILASGLDWTSGANPWENAPIHLIQLYTPSLAQIGIDNSYGFVCATTFPGLTRPRVSQDTVSSYPGDGAQGIPTAQNAGEGPFAGTTAGRELFVYLDQASHQGFAQVQLLSASLTGPDGPVAVNWVDNTTPQIGSYLTGAIIGPSAPLRPHASYTAAVTVADGAAPISHSWTFTTASAPNASVTVSGSSITFSSANPAGGRLRVFVPPDSGSYYILDQPISTGTSALATSNLPVDTQLEACVSQPAANGYDPASVCSQPFTISSGGNGGGNGGGGGGGNGGGGGGGGGGGNGGRDTATAGGGSPQATCFVPRLRRMTLGHAKQALRRAHCRLGKVRRPRHVTHHRTLRVTGQSAQPYAHHPPNYPVNITLRA